MNASFYSPSLEKDPDNLRVRLLGEHNEIFETKRRVRHENSSHYWPVGTSVVLRGLRPASDDVSRDDACGHAPLVTNQLPATLSREGQRRMGKASIRAIPYGLADLEDWLSAPYTVNGRCDG